MEKIVCPCKDTLQEWKCHYCNEKFESLEEIKTHIWKKHANRRLFKLHPEVFVPENWREVKK